VKTLGNVTAVWVTPVGCRFASLRLAELLDSARFVHYIGSIEGFPHFDESPMDIAGVRELLHKEPFEPFVIRLANGRLLRVPHPDFVAVTSRRAIVVAEHGSWSIVEPLLIVSLDKMPRQGKGGNGSRRKRKKS